MNVNAGSPFFPLYFDGNGVLILLDGPEVTPTEFWQSCSFSCSVVLICASFRNDSIHAIASPISLALRQIAASCINVAGIVVFGAGGHVASSTCRYVNM